MFFFNKLFLFFFKSKEEIFNEGIRQGKLAVTQDIEHKAYKEAFDQGLLHGYRIGFEEGLINGKEEFHKRNSSKKKSVVKK